jgi:chemosensory pili system protein ChpA (sensor histidine kinase/response regulator)
LSIGVPASLVEVVKRVTGSELEQAYRAGKIEYKGEKIPLYWGGALFQASARSVEMIGKTQPVVIFRSAGQRLAAHVDEVLGNQEVVVKNLGPQLSRLPGLSGMSVLASGAVVLIYNPVALTTFYGDQVRALEGSGRISELAEATVAVIENRPVLKAAMGVVPLVLVVDDSITVRRVTQRLLKREGYRVALASDGRHALEVLQEERPTVVVSDIEMPRMDGFELARYIRADVELNDLPIIMITSRMADKHREHALELGVNNYLGKPYNEEELLGLIKHYAKLEVTA